ncbi:hypothetical protein DSM3645_23316 [Blastopirellula marina DSM 3645]|uniref:Uncharacterized protein n=1 Tax=Blastopirellula marina DSM 3645 TaxID=314230 RepID=A3ZQA0_9BACT|nr:hypothetical protein DSM3645_23316 [Blastopirellula marina DSM 3645]
MSILQKIQATNNAQRMYTVRGDLSEESPGQFRVTFTKDAYALIAMNNIHPDFILPLARGEDPSGRNSKFAFKLLEGAEVELHVDTLTHKFKVAQKERAFYIDEHDLSVVYLDSLKLRDCPFECRKYVTVVDVYCCGNGFTKAGYGYVGCADMWCDESRCCPDRVRGHKCGCA